MLLPNSYLKLPGTLFLVLMGESNLNSSMFSLITLPSPKLNTKPSVFT